MPATANDIVALARTHLSDSVGQGRFTDQAMLTELNPIVCEMTRRLLFPEYRLTFSTIAGVQEYTIGVEVIRTLRVYINGQLIVPADIPTLEGTQIQLYDQSGTGGTPQFQGGGPAGNVGTASPAWTTQIAENYPVLQTYGYPAPDAVPWFTGSRPRHYWRGGNLCFVPIPLAAGAIVTVDGIFGPSTVTALAQQLLLPTLFTRAASFELASIMLYSDRDGGGNMQMAEKWHERYDELWKELRAWRRRYDGQKPRGPKMVTQRSFYTAGARRNYGGGGY